MNKHVLLVDRDGTLIKEEPYLSDPSLVKLENNVGDTLHLISKKNIPIVVITNQSGVGRGYFSWQHLAAVNHQVECLLQAFDVQISAWYVCPHHPTEGKNQFKKNCHCRKPKPGLILEACKDFETTPETCWFVGDRASDMQAGYQAGCQSFWVQSGLAKEMDASNMPKGTKKINHFADLLHFI